MGNSIWNLFAGTYFSDQAGTGKSIEGIFHNNVNTVSNYADFLAVEKELLNRGTIPNFYLTNSAGYVKLKGLLKSDNVVGESVQRPIDGFVTANTVSGIPLVVSYNVGGTGQPNAILRAWEFQRPFHSRIRANTVHDRRFDRGGRGRNAH
jgi:hypothetical protein